MILGLSAARRRPLRVPPAPARRPDSRPPRLGGQALGLLVVLASLLGPAPGLRASSLEDIRALEDRISAIGVLTAVRGDCPPNHAGYVERDRQGRHHLVLCRNAVDLSDLDAVWEVMAHEATHIMQTCTGGTAIADDHMPRTVRELRSMAPHYAKLIERGYPSLDQRLEAEAFWMELQTPAAVMGLFDNLCASGLPKR